MSTTYKVALLTGQLIVPAGASPGVLAGGLLTLSEVARRIARWTPGWDCRLTRLPDHAWQMAVAPPPLALRAALLVQARLAAAPDALQARIAIGLGDIAFASGEAAKDLQQAQGSALPRSTRALERMPKLHRIALAPDAPLFQTVALLADQLARGWTREQAEAMALALPPDNPTLAVMSDRLGISKQAVNYRLAGAGLRSLRAALASWEASFAQGLPQPDRAIPPI